MPIADKTFQEWSLKVLEELVELNRKTDSVAAKQDSISEEVENRLNEIEADAQERDRRIDQKLDTINLLLNGNGSPEKGLIVRVDRLEQRDIEDLDIRVDRLEQTESRRTWLMRLCVGSCIAAVFTTLSSYFRHL